jgi:hypothetical protein
MKRSFTTLAVVVVALTGSIRMPAQATDPLAGTWKLNVEKSKFGAAPAPKSSILKYEIHGDEVKNTSDTVEADGTKVHGSYTAKFDGKEYPVTGDPDRDTTTMKRINAYATEVIGKKAGKPTITFRRVVSLDGKSLTLRETGVDGKGQKVSIVEVFDKQ